MELWTTGSGLRILMSNYRLFLFLQAALAYPLNILLKLLMEEILHRCEQYSMTSTPAPPVQCCVLKHCAPVQDFSHSTSLLLWQIFPTNVKWGAWGSRLQVRLVVQDFFINRTCSCTRTQPCLTDYLSTCTLLHTFAPTVGQWMDRWPAWVTK